MSRALQPEDQIAHYRVVGPLGVGGMGEVYLAQDQTLERSVALKVLPTGLVRNEERVRRFVTEAKSASSLSHPHIVTIYEIGQDSVKSADGESTDEEPLHYISMELIQGETLHDKIHHHKTDLRTLLGYLAQAAEGLAKAHASNIVHRDLKPSNIMVSRDGYAKVLDFGLAKLTERTQSDGEATMTATAVAPLTGEGVVLGTVGYMSPEQVRGKVVDHRADIFSFGCILYEAATRRRPFKADSDVETMHQILNQQPEAVEEISPEVPDALRRLIKRCLAKSTDRRLHSMKDIAIELAEIVEEFDTLAPSKSASAMNAPALAPKSKWSNPAMLAIGAFGIAAIAFAIWSGLRKTPEPASTAQPFQTMTMRSIVRSDDLRGPVLSRDGRYLAYRIGSGENSELWVRQVATGSQVKIYDSGRGFSSLSFTPDGNYIFFRMQDPETPNYGAIFSIPTLGGTPRKRIFDVDSPVSFSPDGSRVCFRRGLPQVARDQLVLVKLDDGSETVLAEIEKPLMISDPVWSPDGGSIVWSTGRMEGGFQARLEIFPLAGGDPRLVDLPRGVGLFDIEWLAGEQQVVGAARGIPDGRPQIWIFDLETGQPLRVTNDLNDYVEISVGENGDVISAIRGSGMSEIWKLGIDGKEPAQRIDFGGSDQQFGVLLALPDGDLLAERVRAESGELVRVPMDGSGVRPLGAGSASQFLPRLSRDRVAFMRVQKESLPHIWSMDLEGGDIRQLTNGGGEWLHDVSPDGRHVLYSTADSSPQLRMLDTESGDFTLLEEPYSGVGGALFSSDGRYVVYGSLRERGGRWVRHFILVSVETGQLLREIPPPRPGLVAHRWIPGQEALSYAVNAAEGSENIFRIGIDGSAEIQLTSFEDGQIADGLWGPEGTFLVVVRRHESRFSLWFMPCDAGLPAGEATELASFDQGFISDLVWLEAHNAIAFRHTTVTHDVVLVRDFQ